MKTAVIIILIFILPGVIMGTVSSYRAGQKPHETVLLKLRNFAQWEKWPHMWRHIKDLWAYYGLAIMFLLVALSE